MPRGFYERKTLLQRLTEKYSIDEVTGCWNWTAGKFSSGYGAIRSGERLRRAHRVSYEIHCEPIPDGLRVLHKCDNPGCINPSHLFLGTDADNAADKISKGRQVNARGDAVSNPGIANGNSKLSEADVIAIRSAIGVSQRKLAVMFGVGPTQIRRIRAGDSWAHLSRKQVAA